MLVVTKNGVEVIRYRDEWCMSLPEWWSKSCGCSRTCSMDSLWGSLSVEAREMLAEYGYTTIDGWAIIRDGSSIILFPWPKKLYSQSLLG